MTVATEDWYAINQTSQKKPFWMRRDGPTSRNTNFVVKLKDGANQEDEEKYHSPHYLRSWPILRVKMNR
eukprot:509091-Prorocentrum_lima.AAC.1